MREFWIELNHYAVWAIVAKEYEDKFNEKNQNKNFFYKYFIAYFHTIDGKIMYLEDPFFHDNWYDLAKDDPTMQEVCKFEDGDTNTVFVGTFVDALKYVEKRMGEILKQRRKTPPKDRIY